MDEQYYDHSDDERLVRASLRAAYPPSRSVFSQRRGEQIIRASALEQRQQRRDRTFTCSRVAASIAATLTLLAGTAGAAGAALPGQPLYPLKRVVERAMVAVTADDSDAAKLELRFAERRLREASAVGTEEPAATSLIEKFNEHLNAATALGGNEISEEVAELERSQDTGKANRQATEHATASSAPVEPPAMASRSPEPSSSPSASMTPSPSPSPSPSASPSPSESASPSPRATPDDESKGGTVTIPRRLLPLDDGAPRGRGRGVQNDRGGR